MGTSKGHNASILNASNPFGALNGVEEYPETQQLGTIRGNKEMVQQEEHHEFVDCEDMDILQQEQQAL